jgi:sorbitol-specific phosphotransferase system component IIBC
MKIKLATAALLLAAVLIPSAGVLAAGTPPNLDGFGVKFAENVGLQNANPKNVIVNVIQVILSFLAIVAVIIILIGGFLWMTAGGNDEKVTQGRKSLANGAIGLLIVLAAFAITNFLINTIQNNIVNDKS